MEILIKSILFVMNKWDTSMDEFKLVGKILFYVPMMLNNILSQVFYFSLLPFVMAYIWGKGQSEPLMTLFNLYAINSSLNK